MVDRLTAARQVLMQAETAVGLGRTSPLSYVSASSGQEKNPLVGSSEGVPGESEEWADQMGWPVPHGLHSLFPYGLRRGSTVGVRGSRLAGLLMVGLASSQGAWVACIGIPNMGWGMARLFGVDFERFIFIPGCTDPLLAQAISTAIDGFDVVLVGRQVILGSHEKRLLARRALSRQVLLIGEGWESREQVQGQLIAVEGVSAGNGHIRELLLDVCRPGGKPSRVAITSQGWRVHKKLQLVPVSSMSKAVVSKSVERGALRSAEEGSPSPVLSKILESASVRMTSETTKNSAKGAGNGGTDGIAAREALTTEISIRALEMVPS